jgi:hypothetical protein
LVGYWIGALLLTISHLVNVESECFVTPKKNNKKDKKTLNQGKLVETLTLANNCFIFRSFLEIKQLREKTMTVLTVLNIQQCSLNLSFNKTSRLQWQKRRKI